jgi:hypothetical protein
MVPQHCFLLLYVQPSGTLMITRFLPERTAGPGIAAHELQQEGKEGVRVPTAAQNSGHQRRNAAGYFSAQVSLTRTESHQLLQTLESRKNFLFI